MTDLTNAISNDLNNKGVFDLFKNYGYYHNFMHDTHWSKSYHRNQTNIVVLEDVKTSEIDENYDKFVCQPVRPSTCNTVIGPRAGQLNEVIDEAVQSDETHLGKMFRRQGLDFRLYHAFNQFRGFQNCGVHDLFSVILSLSEWDYVDSGRIVGFKQYVNGLGDDDDTDVELLREQSSMGVLLFEEEKQELQRPLRDLYWYSRSDFVDAQDETHLNTLYNWSYVGEATCFSEFVVDIINVCKARNGSNPHFKFNNPRIIVAFPNLSDGDVTEYMTQIVPGYRAGHTWSSNVIASGLVHNDLELTFDDTTSIRVNSQDLEDYHFLASINRYPDFIWTDRVDSVPLSDFISIQEPRFSTKLAWRMDMLTRPGDWTTPMEYSDTLFYYYQNAVKIYKSIEMVVFGDLWNPRPHRSYDPMVSRLYSYGYRMLSSWLTIGYDPVNCSFYPRGFTSPSFSLFKKAKTFSITIPPKCYYTLETDKTKYCLRCPSKFLDVATRAVLLRQDLHPNTDYFLSLCSSDVNAENRIEVVSYKTDIRTSFLVVQGDEPVTRYFPLQLFSILGNSAKVLVDDQFVNWLSYRDIDIDLLTIPQINTDNLENDYVFDDNYDPFSQQVASQNSFDGSA